MYGGPRLKGTKLRTHFPQLSTSTTTLWNEIYSVRVVLFEKMKRCIWTDFAGSDLLWNYIVSKLVIFGFTMGDPVCHTWRHTRGKPHRISPLMIGSRMNPSLYFCSRQTFFPIFLLTPHWIPAGPHIKMTNFKLSLPTTKDRCKKSVPYVCRPCLKEQLYGLQINLSCRGGSRGCLEVGEIFGPPIDQVHHTSMCVCIAST